MGVYFGPLDGQPRFPFSLGHNGMPSFAQTLGFKLTLYLFFSGHVQVRWYIVRIESRLTYSANYTFSEIRVLSYRERDFNAPPRVHTGLLEDLFRAAGCKDHGIRKACSRRRKDRRRV